MTKSLLSFQSKNKRLTLDLLEDLKYHENF